MPMDHPLAGTLGLWAIESNGGRVSMVSGWPRARWWTSALHFWDDFSADGELGPDAADPGPVGCRLRAARSRARRDGDIHVPHHVALPQPHARPVRVGRVGRPGRKHHRQLLLHAVRGRVGGGALHGVEPRGAGIAHAAVRRRVPREHAAGRRQGRRVGESLDARDADGASAPPTASSTASKAVGDTAAAAWATARTSGTTRPRRSTCSRASRTRCAAPPSATRWTRTAACTSASCCPTASIASRRPRPTARWARS